MSFGETIPTRYELATKYGAARATIDKAIAELVSEGILSSRPGSGTFVAKEDSETNLIQNWGLIVPDITEEIYSGISRGVENYAQKIKANIILCNSDNSLSKQADYLNRLYSSNVSGIILVPVIFSDIDSLHDLYSQLIATRIPFVFCNRSVDGIEAPLIASNDFYGAYLATKHLIRQGYRKPAFISKVKYKTSNDRCQGYLSALLEKEIPINRNTIVMNLPEEGSKDKIASLIQKEGIDSIFCFDDTIAELCYDVIDSLGINIPNQIGIIGYNNSSLCTKLFPPLTSVSFKNTEIGDKAADVLYKLIMNRSHNEFETYLFQPTVEIRESTRRKITSADSN